MKRRTKKRILLDSERILYEARNCTTLNEIAVNLNLTISQVKTSIKEASIREQVSSLLKIGEVRIKENKKSSKKGDKKDRHYHGVNTMAGISLRNGKCMFSIQSNEKKYVELISSSYIYSDGQHEINTGDEIMIARLTKGFVLVIHYDVIKLDVKQNVRVRYTQKMSLEKRNIDEKFDSEHIVFVRDALAHFVKMRNL